MISPAFGIVSGFVVFCAFPLARWGSDVLIRTADRDWAESSIEWVKEAGASDDVLSTLERLDARCPKVLSRKMEWVLRTLWGLATGLWVATMNDLIAVVVGTLTSFLLLVAAHVDLRTKILPDPVTISIAGLGCLFVLAGWGPSPADAILGLLTGFLSFFVLGVAFRHFRGREMLGLGDIKLFAVAGVWVGWQGLPMTAGLASLIGLAMILGSGTSAPRTVETVAFGPAIALAMIVVGATV
ncbi:MAG: A24 family peptidase [Pseudomonadota bacterium]